MLANLLNNSAKYTPEGGQIALTATQAGHTVVIRVRDNGIGIAADLLPKVFDLFVQADQTLSRSRGGLGIGLTLVRSLVELHGGRVTAPGATGPAREASSRSELPLASGATTGPTGARKPDDRDIPLPRRRILVVDDNLSNATSLEVLLRALGQEVHTAHDGRTAVEMARKLQPEVVLLDIGLPVHGWLRGGPPMPAGAGTGADDLGGDDGIWKGRRQASLAKSRFQCPPRQARESGGPSPPIE